MADVVARYNRALGFNVVPLAGDGRAAVAQMQLKSMGLSFGFNGETTASVLTGFRHRPATGRADGSEVDPEDIIDAYGADATRWFVLSDSPPDREMIWTENGIRGAWRFVHRLWRLINGAEKYSHGAPAARPPVFSTPAQDVRRTAYRALAQVSGNIERLRFNVCVARIYTFVRALEAVTTGSSKPASPDLKFAAREAAEMLVQLFHPMMPHLAEECWAALGHQSLLAIQSWPVLEADLLVDDNATLPVHVNGRRRADVTVARDARNGDIEASVLAVDAVRRALGGKAPRKVIIVPQRIINVVA
jgi:leucyl-tRNA synthetase